MTRTPSAWIVLKFGGTSVSTLANWTNIARVAAARSAGGARVLIVHSAVTGITDRLERLLDAATAEAQRGSAIFDELGCATCHVRTLTTAPAGTVINGGDFVIPAALGDKTFHPFGDFLLHDVGTGDAIVQNGGHDTANKMRTPPLWGVRMRNRLMHDGESLTFENAIARHRGEAEEVVEQFRQLTPQQKGSLIAFLHSL